jgi:hypothetical protein
VRTVILENLKEQIDPDKAVVRNLTIELIDNEAYQKYFFEGLDNPSWIPPLDQLDYFYQIPQPVEVEPGQFQLPLWFAGKYLSRNAHEYPEIVLDVALHIETENYRVIDNMLDALLNIEPEMASKASGAVCKWMNTQFARILPIKVSEYLEFIIGKGYTEAALDILSELLRPIEPLPRKVENLYFFPEVRTNFEKYWLHEALEKNLPQLISEDPIGVINVAESCLIKSIEFELGAAGKDPESDSPSFWRDSIAGPINKHQSNELKNLQVDAIRDALLETCKHSSETSEFIISRFLESNHSIFRRIAIFVLGEEGEQFPALLRFCFTNNEFLDINSTDLEFYTLMRCQFINLQESEQVVIEPT